MFSETTYQFGIFPTQSVPAHILCRSEIHKFTTATGHNYQGTIWENVKIFSEITKPIEPELL